MTRITGPITLSSTPGIKAITAGFQPTWAEFRVCQKYGTNESFAHLSIGECDADGYQNVTSIFQDATGGISITDSTKVISHYARVGGTIQEVLAVKFDSFTSNGMKLNVLTGNSGYQIMATIGN